MAYSIEEQYSRDLDWYFKDASGNFFHVASAGGRLPEIIAENDDLNNSIHNEVQKLPQRCEVEINPLLNEIKGFENGSQQRELYLTDFVEAASKGFISLDKNILGNFENPNYHIVAWPRKFLSELNIEEMITIKNEIDFTQFQSFNLLQKFE